MGGKWEVMFAFSSLVGWLYDERWTDGSLCTEQRAGQRVATGAVTLTVTYQIPPLPPRKKLSDSDTVSFRLDIDDDDDRITFFFLTSSNLFFV